MSAGLETIVAEVSTNWPGGDGPISAKFEGVIEFNRQRGYYLDSWRFSQVVVRDGLVETIIAVFAKVQT